jgi:signal transduction histidine kinase
MLDRLNKFSTERVLIHGAQYETFAWFSLLNYPVSFLLLYYFESQFNEDLLIRLIAVALSVPLLLVEKWPQKIKKYAPLYWHFTILYSIPFFATFMLLNNQLSLEWLMNVSLGLFWFVLLVDWLTFAILLFLGSFLGFLVFVLIGNIDIAELTLRDSSVTTLSFYMYTYAVVIGLLFSRKNSLLVNERQQTLKSMAAAIAHELRTPLANVSLSGYGIKKHLEKIDTYLSTLGQGHSSIKQELKGLDQTAGVLINIARRSQNLINLLLTNLKENLEQMPKTILSMGEVIACSLQEFAYKPNEEKKIHLDAQSDFQFQGNRDLMTHVFFNLLKNSLYFIQAAGKGEIFITIKSDSDYNFVIFKDTGTGIDKDQLPYLFKPFYSNRPHGTGVGLSFCKRAIESMNGTIDVTSKVGEYTAFTMKFPKVPDHIQTSKSLNKER